MIGQYFSNKNKNTTVPKTKKIENVSIGFCLATVSSKVTNIFGEI